MKILLIVIFVGLATSSNSTCILISKDAKYIYIAADSRVSYKGTYRTICKIQSNGSIYYAMAGGGTATVQSAAAYSIKKSNYQIEAAIKMFIDSITPFFTRYMVYTKNHDTATYNHCIQNTVASICFCFFQNNQPKLIEITFKLKIINGKVNVYNEIHKDLNQVELGIHDHIDRITPAETAKFKTTNILEFAEDLIKYEISFHKKDIGEPIDLVTIDAQKGLIWYSPKRDCN